MKTLPHHVIQCGEYHIGVPQCDETSANIFVAFADSHLRYQRGGQTSYPLIIPSMKRQYRQPTPHDRLGITPDIYDSVVEKNKASIIALINTLNGADKRDVQIAMFC